MLATSVARQNKLNQSIAETLDKKLAAEKHLDAILPDIPTRYISAWDKMAFKMMSICDSVEQVIPIRSGHIHSVTPEWGDGYRAVFYLPPGNHQLCLRTEFREDVSYFDFDQAPAKESIVELQGGKAYSITIGLDDSRELYADYKIFSVVKISLDGPQVNKVFEIPNPVSKGRKDVEMDVEITLNTDDKIVLPNTIPKSYFKGETERAAFLKSRKADVEIQNLELAITPSGEADPAGVLGIQLSIQSETKPALMPTDSGLYFKFFFKPYPTPESLHLRFDADKMRYVPLE